MGVALGCIGMSMKDFEQCTPSEFYSIFEKWKEIKAVETRSSWQRTRILLIGLLQPWSKYSLDAHEVLPLPWDEDNGTPDEKLSEEEIDARFEAAKKRYGLK